jgi:hypothetical protein
MKLRNRRWLVKLCIVEFGIAGAIMLAGYPPGGVFMMAMAAHSAWLAGRY